MVYGVRMTSPFLLVILKPGDKVHDSFVVTFSIERQKESSMQRGWNFSWASHRLNTWKTLSKSTSSSLNGKVVLLTTYKRYSTEYKEADIFFCREKKKQHIFSFPFQYLWAKSSIKPRVAVEISRFPPKCHRQRLYTCFTVFWIVFHGIW